MTNIGIRNLSGSAPSVSNEDSTGRQTKAAKWFQYLMEPVDGASLAAFRICFAVCMVVNTLTYGPEVEADYILPKFNFSFIPGLHPLPGVGMHILFGAMAFAAASMGLGFFYRVAAVVFFSAFTYVFLLDKAYYQNHFYLTCLLGFLLIFIPANRVLSLDNADGKMPRSVPRWSVLVLRAQIACVYFFGGIAKLNYDWIVRMEPHHTYFQQIAPESVLGPIISQPWFSQLVSYGGIAFDLSLGFLLWYPRTFWLGAAMALSFHLMNSQLFKIGIFPWLMIATIGLFPRPDWPRRVLGKLEVTKKQAVSYAERARKNRLVESAAHRDVDSVVVGEPQIAIDAEASTQHAVRVSRSNLVLLTLMHIFVLLQILIPLRRVFYSGDNSWTEYGHRFSWQMMLRSKLVPSFVVYVLDPRTQKPLPVELDKILNSRQVEHMVTRPDMILQFAHFVADNYQKKNGIRPVVKVAATETLNFRPAQDFIDPNVDLASQPDRWPAPWVVPLKDLK